MTSTQIVGFIGVCGVFVGILAAIPYLVTRFTLPGWVVFKSSAEFVVFAVLFCLLVPKIVGLACAGTLAMLRHKQRARRHRESLALTKPEQPKTRSRLGRFGVNQDKDRSPYAPPKANVDNMVN